MKLAEVQLKLKAPKSQFNAFGKYKYRSAEDILEALKPVLNGEATVTLSDELVQVGERYYVKSTALFKSDEETISVSAFAREEENKKGQDGSQITGSSSSYARKYALNGMFLIDDAKDSDSTNTHETTETTKANSNGDAIKQLKYKLNKYKKQDELEKDKIELRDTYVGMGVNKKEATDLVMNKLAELQNVSA